MDIEINKNNDNYLIIIRENGEILYQALFRNCEIRFQSNKNFISKKVKDKEFMYCSWIIPNIGTLRINSDNDVFFNQTEDKLDSISFKIENCLLIENINSQYISIKSKETYILSTLIAEHVEMDGKVINRGVIQVNSMICKEDLINTSVVLINNIGQIKNMNNNNSVIKASQLNCVSFENNKKCKIKIDSLNFDEIIYIHPIY